MPSQRAVSSRGVQGERGHPAAAQAATAQQSELGEQQLLKGQAAPAERLLGLTSGQVQGG
ncbi:MAG: hypothetical protein M3Y09_11210 [Actinomycetota bacterium]|nr:hypothetical protein [Actinomycetota bacterium]